MSVRVLLRTTADDQCFALEAESLERARVMVATVAFVPVARRGGERVLLSTRHVLTLEELHEPSIYEPELLGASG